MGRKASTGEARKASEEGKALFGVYEAELRICWRLGWRKTNRLQRSLLGKRCVSVRDGVTDTEPIVNSPVCVSRRPSHDALSASTHLTPRPKRTGIKASPNEQLAYVLRVRRR